MRNIIFAALVAVVTFAQPTTPPTQPTGAFRYPVISGNPVVGQCAQWVASTRLGSVACGSHTHALSDMTGSVTDAQVPDNITINLAATATALAATPYNCPAGYAAAGITAWGSAQNCVLVTMPWTGIGFWDGGAQRVAIPGVDYALPPARAFVESAFTDTTNASNLSSGTLATARMPTQWAPALGTVTTNTPFLNASVTFNNAGVQFDGLIATFTCTACTSSSRLASFLIGSTKYLEVTKAGTTTIQGPLVSEAAGLNAANGTCISWSTIASPRSCLYSSVDGVINFGKGAQTNANILHAAAPTIASGFGTSPSIAGTDTTGRVTVGTGGTASTGAITFGITWATAPVCVANNETTTLLVKATATTSTLTLTSASAWTAADKLTFHCWGY